MSIHSKKEVKITTEQKFKRQKAAAVIDLGSNSFHLTVVRPDGEDFEVVERSKEKVQLLAGFRDGELSEEAIARGVACIERFAQRVAGIKKKQVQIKGTFALRQANNRHRITDVVEKQLGLPVDVISGEEEARQIFVGVAHHLPRSDACRLVIDIGGGSTEIVLGSGFDLDKAVSLKAGCVAATDLYFPHPELISAAMDDARTAAEKTFRRAKFDIQQAQEFYGTSGTIESVQTVLAANGWGEEAITAKGLDQLYASIIDRTSLVDLGIPGLQPERVDIFPAGVAILSAIFRVFKLKKLHYIDASLRDGVLFEMFSAPGRQDVQQHVIKVFAERYRVDLNQAFRVEKLANHLLQSVAVDWFLDDEQCKRLLSFAARLHQVGFLVGVRHYHRHGAYLIANSTMRGFSQQEQRLLSLLVRCHRRRLPNLAFSAFDAETAQKALRLVVLLRIAVILMRGYRHEDDFDPKAEVNGSALTLHLSKHWLATHPLSRKELQVEVEMLADIGFELILGSE